MWPMTKYESTEDNKRAIVILVRGLPGSGKTYMAQKLIPLLDRRVVLLDPDTVDTDSQEYRQHVETLLHEGVDERLHLYRFLRGQAYQGIASGDIVMWNQPFTNLDIFNKMVANFQLQADEKNVHLSVLVVEVMLDPEVAQKRVIERKQSGGHGPSAAAFDTFTKDYVSFAPEGYHVVSVPGDDAERAITLIQKELEQLG